MFVIHKGTGESVGNEVFINCEDDFRDIRFVSSSGVPLPYWIESLNYGNNATVWVRILDDLSLDDSTIYLLWGNSEAQSESNGYEVFDIFSDFSRFFDDQTWYRFLSTDAQVFAYEKWSKELSWLSHTEVEGISYDGEYFYISTAKQIDGQGNASLYKITTNGSLVKSVLIEDGSLNHAGGIELKNGLLWVPLTERSSSPEVPSVVLQYNLNLEYVDTWLDSSGVDNAHWGAICFDSYNELVYISDYGTSTIFIYTLDGTLVKTENNPPDSSIQSMYILDGLLYGAQSGFGADDIVVWDLGNDGLTLRRRGILNTPSGLTGNALTWYNGSWYCTSGSSPVTLHELAGDDLSLKISNYFIESRRLVKPGNALEGYIKMGGNQAFNIGFASYWPASNPQIIGHANQGMISIYNGSSDYGNLSIPDDWFRLGIYWNSERAELWKNQQESITMNHTLHVNFLKPGIQLWGSADTPIYIKWLFVRKWNNTIPIQGTWETSSCPSMTTTTETPTSTSTTQLPQPQWEPILIVAVVVTFTIAVLVYIMKRYHH